MGSSSGKKNSPKYWVITDTHFGHDNMQEYCSRPEGVEQLLLKNIARETNPEDIIIHLGDICIGKDEYWHEWFCSHILSKLWLVRGNHDKKSLTWYLNHGWDFVADSFTLNAFGHRILFSHVPHLDNGYTLNIHGHSHNNDHRDQESIAIKNDKQILVSMEKLNYCPIQLKTIVGKWLRK